MFSKLNEQFKAKSKIASNQKEILTKELSPNIIVAQQSEFLLQHLVSINITDQVFDDMDCCCDSFPLQSAKIASQSQ